MRFAFAINKKGHLRKQSVTSGGGFRPRKENGQISPKKLRREKMKNIINVPAVTNVFSNV